MPVCSRAAAADDTMRRRQRPAISCIDNVNLRRAGARGRICDRPQLQA
jgi:hypothetical protein